MTKAKLSFFWTSNSEGNGSHGNKGTIFFRFSKFSKVCHIYKTLFRWNRLSTSGYRCLSALCWKLWIQKLGELQLSYSMFCVCSRLSSTDYWPEFYCFSLIYGNRYVSVPAEISCSLAPSLKKHCISQCFVLGFLNLILERYKKF